MSLSNPETNTDMMWAPKHYTDLSESHGIPEIVFLEKQGEMFRIESLGLMCTSDRCV